MFTAFSGARRREINASVNMSLALLVFLRAVEFTTGKLTVSRDNKCVALSDLWQSDGDPVLEYIQQQAIGRTIISAGRAVWFITACLLPASQ